MHNYNFLCTSIKQWRIWMSALYTGYHPYNENNNKNVNFNIGPSQLLWCFSILLEASKFESPFIVAWKRATIAFFFFWKKKKEESSRFGMTTNDDNFLSWVNFSLRQKCVFWGGEGGICHCDYWVVGRLAGCHLTVKCTFSCCPMTLL